MNKAADGIGGLRRVALTATSKTADDIRGFVGGIIHHHAAANGVAAFSGS